MTSATESLDPNLLPLLDLAQAMVRDLDGRITHWTSGAEHLYGWSRQEAVGQIAHDLLATEFPVPLDEIQASLLRESQWHGELRHRTREGRTIQVASHWTLRRGTGGQPDSVAEVNNDITAQSRAEDALLRLAAIFASSNDAIIGMTLDGAITDWNEAAASLFGYSAAEIMGQPVTVLYPPERMGEELTLLGRIRRGEPVSHFETIRRRRDGSTLPVSVNLSAILDASGTVIGASKIVRDLSESQARDKRLAEVQAELTHVSRLIELGQLVSSLVHEVNQPLTAIGNYTQAIQRLLAAGNAERVPLALEKIVEQTERAYQIIQRLRDFVRKGQSQRRAERLGETIQEAIALAAIGPAARGATIRTEVAPGVDRVEIDRIQIEQVLFNLLRNALEAMQGQPRREVLVRAQPAADGMVEVAVADSGPGLPDTVRQKLFQPFVTTKAAGMGVGLSVCKGIVEAHGGQMTADDRPGGGTVFRFTVPAVSAAQAAAMGNSRGVEQPC
ncbi:MAG TPA: PAS domain S-box protein [Acetobacteraceae bacterium]|nr:PAS domain S-box protein [Acetobacteraceae bacterium]